MREMKDSGIEWIGEIPSDWGISKIKFVADFEPTCNFENISPEDRIAYAPMECIKQGFYEARDALYEELSHSLTPFQNGDIVMAKVTPCFENGNIAIMNKLPSGIGLGSSELFVFRAKNIVAKYLFYWLQNSDFIQRACSTMTGVGGLKRVSPFFCKNCEIHIPPYNEQCRIADYLDRKCSQIDAIIARQQEVIEKLKAYKLSVITEAVTKGLNPNVPMKDSGIDFIGSIPETWRICRLRNIGTLQNGISKGGEFFGHGFPFVSYGDVYRNFSLPVQVAGLIDSSDEERRNYSVESGDIFFTRTSETIEEVGFSSVCEETIPDATFAGFLIRVRPFTDDLESRFAKYYFRSNHHRYYLVKQMNLVTRASLGQDLLKSMPVLVPPKEEQIRIAKYLDKKCNAIETSIAYKQKIVDRLTAYKKSLIYEVVTGKKEVKR